MNLLLESGSILTKLKDDKCMVQSFLFSFTTPLPHFHLPSTFQTSLLSLTPHSLSLPLLMFLPLPPSTFFYHSPPLFSTHLLFNSPSTSQISLLPTPFLLTPHSFSLSFLTFLPLPPSLLFLLPFSSFFPLPPSPSLLLTPFYLSHSTSSSSLTFLPHFTFSL